jgi:ATP-dependent RNA helicase DDX18/HAS1
LISKNYYLHQSARDGFRAYIQSYASYSLKTIFDVSALDLAKVGMAFGFSTPPSVNINIGAGLKNKKKRKLDQAGNKIGGSDESGEDEEASEEEESEDEAEAMTGRRAKAAAMARKGGNGVEKRREIHGAKSGQKDFYREGRAKKEGNGDGKQWSR